MQVVSKIVVEIAKKLVQYVHMVNNAEKRVQFAIIGKRAAAFRLPRKEKMRVLQCASKPRLQVAQIAPQHQYFFIVFFLVVHFLVVHFQFS